MLWILCAITGTLLLLMRKLLLPNRNIVKYEGVGIILKRLQENCRISFYIRFCDEENISLTGESIPYSSTGGKYYEGDCVPIKYYFSPKGRPFVEIDDPELVSCENEAKPIALLMLIVAVFMYVLATANLIINLIQLVP